MKNTPEIFRFVLDAREVNVQRTTLLKTLSVKITLTKYKLHFSNNKDVTYLETCLGGPIIFYPCCVREWNELGPELRKTTSISLFKKSLLEFKIFNRPKTSPIFNIFDPRGIKLLTRLRVYLSYLREHMYQYNLLDTRNPLCSCNVENESKKHYLHTISLSKFRTFTQFTP